MLQLRTLPITILSLLSISVGAILDAVTLGRREAKLLAYIRGGK